MSRFGRLLRASAVAAWTAVGMPSPAADQPSAPATLPDVNDFLSGSPLTQAGFGRTQRANPPCSQVPGCAPCAPGSGTLPQIPVTPSPTTGAPIANEVGGEPDFGGRGRGAGAGATVGLNGYIENAAPVTMFRLRYDAGYGDNRPDRGEFFYAKCGCFRGLTPPQLDAHGPPKPETNVDYQELTSSMEYAVNPRLSVFANIPVRFLNPDVNNNTAGLSDVNFGAKYAFVYNDRRILTFALRTITPSGQTISGLGTGNWWLEPGLLWLEQMNPKWQVFGELRDQIPVAPQSNYTGNVLRYGLGTSYMVAQGCRGYIAPVVECVGWTLLSGQETTEAGTVSARGDTILNAKIGVRIGIGSVSAGQPYPTRSDLYIGYGRALTGAVWYKDLLRVEYRYFF